MAKTHAFKTILIDSLYRMRQRAELSQLELAERSGVSVHVISAIERGARYPRATTVEAMLRGMRRTPADLVAAMARWTPVAVKTGTYAVRA